MHELTKSVTITLSYLTVIGDILTIAALLWFLFRRRFSLAVRQRWQNYFSRYGVAFAFGIALIATLGSLFYSEVAGYTPCTLCWYQRIFMYPQVLLWGLALVKREQVIADYGIALSIVGGFIAAYHYALQFVPKPTFCSAVGYSVSCTQDFFLQLGYITIPMMSLTAFLLILLSAIILRQGSRS